MANLSKMAVTFAVVLLLIHFSAQGEKSYLDAIPVFDEYLQLIADGNYEIAADMWTPEALERSSRFGIKFTDIPMKVDCNSPIMRNLGEMEANILSPVRQYEDLDSAQWYRLEYANIYGSSLLKHNYYMQRRGDWFWISYAQDFYGASWPVTVTRYLRIRSHPDARKYLNPAVIAEADRFIEQTASRLGISDSLLQQIAASKIEYYLCPSDSMVEKMTGFLTVGTLDLASNDIISADFPHFHELTHLLINIRLREMPLYTLPVMREGLATWLAGRWGKQTAPLMDLAVFLYKEGLVTFDSIFTMGGFDHESGADIVYPVAGLFCGYLTEKLGMTGCLDLYLGLSGKFTQVNGMTASEVQAKIAKAAKFADWAALKTGFETYLDRHQAERVVARPGLGDIKKTLMDDKSFAVYDDGDWLAFEFRAAPGDSLCQGNLLFAPTDSLKGHISQLFELQYNDKQAFEGFRYGVRYDQNEAGLYDYVTNQLLAKYIWGITPSDQYFDSQQKKISIRFRKSLVAGQLPAKGQFHLLPM